MKQKPSLTALKLLMGSALLTLAGHAAAFCGFYAGKADASLYNEASQVILVRDGERTVISMLNDYQGPLNEFALIVPTPVALKKGQVRVAEKKIFERLDAFSTPRLAEYHDDNPCQLDGPIIRPMAMAARAEVAMMDGNARLARNKALGVTVEAQYTLEEYDIVSLSAKESDGLETWLRENGYTIPKGASAALAPYIKQGMRFFVAKVNLKEKDRLGYSYLRPLQFAFESEKFMLPMRLGMLNAPPGKAQDLIVYALTKNGRVESSNYRTVKLPTDQNLPVFIKPKFTDFYKDMFAQQVKLNNYKAVFTEYFWDMGWCDPCADNPLSTEELRKAGVFWVGGDEKSSFQNLQAPGNKTIRIMPPPGGGGAQPVMITRLHIRYTPESLSEDLMFIQTGDTQNWQTRYVLHHPYKGSVSECSEAAAKHNCQAQCKEQARYGGWSQSDCQKACEEQKKTALQAAKRYYLSDLPKRQIEERKTLAKLTGWNLADIDRMAGGAVLFPKGSESLTPDKPPAAEKTWWEKLFSSVHQVWHRLSVAMTQAAATNA